MCGICGFVNLDGAPAERAIVECMNNAMLHRGPDDAGVRIDGDTALGMRRLSIMDVAGGHQPISNETADVWTVFNGEIYNAAGLRKALQQKGHRFVTTTDTEAIVHGYEADGLACMQPMRGMFAFAVHDVRQGARRLLLVRDRLGIKPLYYYRDHRLLAFASELTTLLQHPGIARGIDPLALNQYLGTGIVASPRTMFAGIRQLMPGHSLLLENGSVSEQAYWELPREPAADAYGRDEAVQRTRTLLESSIEEHLVSDVPVGAFLSGGIDSSSVVALMARVSGKRFPTFSVRFQGRDYDESAYARQVAGRYATEHHEFNVPDHGFDEGLLRAMIGHHGQPTADSSALPTFMVSALARRHVKVALSGDGGDECFAGYSHYGWLRSIERLYAIPRPMRAGLLGLLRKAAEATPLGNVGALRQPINALEASMQGVHRLPLEVLRLNDVHSVESLLMPAWRGDDADAWRELDDMLAGLHGMDDVAVAQRFSCRYFMPDAYLPKVDRMSMAASLEVRVPFLDHRLVEHALSLPGSMHWQAGVGKRVLRAAVADLLPEDIFTHRKQGFSIPLHTWADDAYYRLADEMLSEQAVRWRGIFEPVAVRGLLGRCRGTARRRPALESEYRLSHRLFQLVVFELWCRMYIDELPSSPPSVDVERLLGRAG